MYYKKDLINKIDLQNNFKNHLLAIYGKLSNTIFDYRDVIEVTNAGKSHTTFYIKFLKEK